MTDISKLPPSERAKRYREFARQARIIAASSEGVAQASLIKIAGQWEQLAREAVDDAKQEES